MTGEYILCAAYLLKEELPKEYRTNYQTSEKSKSHYDDIYRCALGRRHNDILQRYGDKVDKTTDGFYTSYGRYVKREEAARIALASGQIERLSYSNKNLYSEDLY